MGSLSGVSVAAALGDETVAGVFESPARSLFSRRLTVGRLTLNQVMGVRVPLREPSEGGDATLDIVVIILILLLLFGGGGYLISAGVNLLWFLVILLVVCAIAGGYWGPRSRYW